MTNKNYPAGSVFPGGTADPVQYDNKFLRLRSGTIRVRHNHQMSMNRKRLGCCGLAHKTARNLLGRYKGRQETSLPFAFCFPVHAGRVAGPFHTAACCTHAGFRQSIDRFNSCLAQQPCALAIGIRNDYTVPYRTARTVCQWPSFRKRFAR